MAGYARLLSLTDDADVYLLKTDANGTAEGGWPKYYGGPSDDFGHSVQQTSDGGYIIAGDKYIPGGYDVYLIKTDKNGNAP